MLLAISAAGLRDADAIGSIGGILVVGGIECVCL
jgi:hypothetical protein